MSRGRTKTRIQVTKQHTPRPSQEGNKQTFDFIDFRTLRTICYSTIPFNDACTCIDNKMILVYLVY